MSTSRERGRGIWSVGVEGIRSEREWKIKGMKRAGEGDRSIEEQEGEMICGDWRSRIWVKSSSAFMV